MSDNASNDSQGRHNEPRAAASAAAVTGPGAGIVLGPKHSGMRISVEGLLGRLRDGGQIRDDIRYTLGELLRHLEEVGARYYAGDVVAVDEFMQLYSLDADRPLKHTTSAGQ